MTPEQMARIRVGLPLEQLERLDRAARLLQSSRAEIVRQAIERYLEDFDDLAMAVERLRDPGDPVLDWDQVKTWPTRTGLSAAPSFLESRRRTGALGGSY